MAAAAAELLESLVTTAQPRSREVEAMRARRVERVEVSQDGGRSWIVAGPSEQHSPWAWRLWEASLILEPGLYTLAVRAWDTAAQTQPEDPAKIWNFKGYVNSAWHRVSVRVEP